MSGKRKLSEGGNPSGSFLRVWIIWQERKRELNIIRYRIYPYGCIFRVQWGKEGQKMSVLYPSASRFRGRATNAKGYEFLYKMETAGR